MRTGRYWMRLRAVLADRGELVRGAAGAKVAQAVLHAGPGTLDGVEGGGVCGQPGDGQPVVVRFDECAHCRAGQQYLGQIHRFLVVTRGLLQSTQLRFPRPGYDCFTHCSLSPVPRMPHKRNQTRPKLTTKRFNHTGPSA